LAIAQLCPCPLANFAGIVWMKRFCFWIWTLFGSWLLKICSSLH